MLLFKKKKLSQAIRNNDLEQAKKFVDAGAKATPKMFESMPRPLQKEMGKILLAAGAARNKKKLDNFVKFIRFNAGMDAEWTKILFEAGATPTARLLEDALFGNDKNLGRALLAAGAVPSEVTLHIAVSTLGYADWVKMLVDATKEPLTDRTFIDAAGRPDMMKILLSRGDVPGERALTHTITFGGDTVCMKLMLEAGAKPTAEMLLLAQSYSQYDGMKDKAQLLTDAGVIATDEDRYNYTVKYAVLAPGMNYDAFSQYERDLQEKYNKAAEKSSRSDTPPTRKKPPQPPRHKP